MATFFITGSTLVLPTAVLAGQDLWLAILVAIVAAVPILAVYARILVLFPGKDLFEIMTIVFGKWIGKVFTLLYAWFAFHLGALVIRNFGDYVKITGIPETPEILPMLILTLLCAWVAKEGIEVLGRWAKFFLIFSSILVVISVLLLSNNWDIHNIQPVLYNGIKPLFGGVWEVIAFPFAETVLFTMVTVKITRRNSIYKMLWGGLFFGGFLVFITSLNEILTLGFDLYSTTYFPTYVTVSLMRVGGFLQRLEIVPAVSLLTGGFVKISVCIIAASRGIGRLFNCSDYRFIVTPIALLMVNLAYMVYGNIIEMMQGAAGTWRYYAFPFQIIFPLLIWIGAEIVSRRRNEEAVSE